ncbi:MAG: AI-2E family transporter [Propionibacteriaceae bacterium]|jgi:predicted PurR-regulated permease PerM|nr:AI-2E family transporter [Propionibacteriaceae bacterium]
MAEDSAKTKHPKSGGTKAVRNLLQAAQVAKAEQAAELAAAERLLLNQQTLVPEISGTDQRIAGDNPDLVPRGLQVAAAWGWRLGVVLLLAAAVCWGASQLSEIVMPLVAAFLFTAAVSPLNDFLRARRFPGWLAALICLLTLVVVVFGLLTLVGVQIGSQWTELSEQAVAGFEDLLLWLNNGPFHITQEQLDSVVAAVLEFMKSRAGDIATMVTTIGGKLGVFLVGMIMTLFALFFFLKDGRKFTTLATGYLPVGVRANLVPAISAGWHTMVNYVRAAVIVAAVDGVGSGLGAMILGSNLWLAITVFTFIMSFVPMLGTATASIVGVLVVFATLGFFKAFLMAIIFLVVLEGEVHLLQPLVLGRAIDIHPLVVLIGIVGGMTVAGPAGGVFAIPLVAMAVGVLREIGRRNALLASAPVPEPSTDPPIE